MSALVTFDAIIIVGGLVGKTKILENKSL
jgi:hypothetical protein